MFKVEGDTPLSFGGKVLTHARSLVSYTVGLSVLPFQLIFMSLKGPGGKGPGDNDPGDKGPRDKGPRDKDPGDKGPENIF